MVRKCKIKKDFEGSSRYGDAESEPGLWSEVFGHPRWCSLCHKPMKLWDWIVGWGECRRGEHWL
jgi:hypothetical protein